MEIGYYAVFNYDVPEGEERIKYYISVIFPDLGIATCGCSHEHSIEMGIEAMRLATAFMEVYELPRVSRPDEIELNEGERLVYISYNTEDVDLSKFTFARGSEPRNYKDYIDELNYLD